MPKPVPFEYAIVVEVGETNPVEEGSVAYFISQVRIVKKCEIRFNHDAIAKAFEQKTREFFECGHRKYIGLDLLLAHITAEKAKWAIKVTVLGKGEESDDSFAILGHFRDWEMAEESRSRIGD